MSRELFEEAYRKYWDISDTWPDHRNCYSYALCDIAMAANWSIPFVGFMVDGELRETINHINSWSRALTNIEIWRKVLLLDYSDEDRWSLRLHFVESEVHYCLLQPSSTRDRLSRIATNSTHQANLTVDSKYKDRLDQDKCGANGFLSRSKVEKQLEYIAGRWLGSNALMKAIHDLDSDMYRDATLNYRNKASHFIAPRLEEGEVELITRRVVPARKLVEQSDGTYQQEEIPGKKAVSYGFGGVRPLTLDEIIDVNLREYYLATAGIDAYSALLMEMMEAINCKRTTTAN